MDKTLDRLLIKKHRGYYLKYICLIHQIEVQAIAEIGVFRGKNAEVLRQEFPDAHLYLIDPWRPDPHYLSSGSAVAEKTRIYEEAYTRVQKRFGNDPHVTLLKKTGAEGAKNTPNTLDLVFIDANHSYEAVKNEILIWKEKVRPGGILAGHNYGRIRLTGVKTAVDEIFGEDFCLGQDEVWWHIKKQRTEEDSNL